MKKYFLLILALLVASVTLSGCQKQSSTASWAWQAGVAIGTIALAVVTAGLVLWNIFGTEWWRKKQMPKLEVRLDRTSSERLGIRFWYELNNETITTFSYWVRPSIGNIGVLPAESVEVYLDEIWKRNDKGLFQQCERHIPMNLRWSVVGPTETDMEKITFIPRITNGLDKPVNLCHVVDPKHRPFITLEEPSWMYELLGPGYHEQPFLHFDTVMETSNESSFWPVGCYLVKLIVAASNTENKDCYIEIDLRDEWFEDEEQMWKEGLVVRVVPEKEAVNLTDVYRRIAEV